MALTTKSLVTFVVNHLVSLSAGKSSITDDDIEKETNCDLQEVMTGLLYLQEELTLNKQTIEEGAKLTLEQEVKLRQAQKLESIGLLAGGIAHDFNNILTIILMTTADLIEDNAGSQRFIDKLRIIENSGNRAAQLTRQLLAFSRQEVIRPTKVHLDECVSSALALLRRTLGEDIKVVYTREDTPELLLDSGQVSQILLNLAINARDAMPQGGTLAIEISNRNFDESNVNSHPGVSIGNNVMLAVSDTGTGIDKSIIDKIFDPFFSTKPKGKGTGLGLSTVFGAIKQNGGSINVYSEVGHGTTFRIYFPVKQNFDASESKSTTRTDSPTVLDNLTVLLVEDVGELRDAITKMLESLGCTVIGAENGQNALDKYRRDKPQIDLLLTDVVMPQMNGKELDQELKKLQPNLRTIFMSGYTENIVVDRGIVKNNVFFLEKPFTKKQLIAIILEVMQ